MLLYILIPVGFIAVLYVISLVVNLLIDGASSAADRALHKRDRRRRSDKDN